MDSCICQGFILLGTAPPTGSAGRPAADRRRAAAG